MNDNQNIRAWKLTDFTPVSAGSIYSATAHLRAQSGEGPVRLGLVFYAGADSSASLGETISDPVTTDWTPCGVSAVAPPGATHARMMVYAEEHYADQLAIYADQLAIREVGPGVVRLRALDEQLRLIG